MNVLLWVLQVLLAMAFFAHGLPLLFPPADMLAQMATVMSNWFRLFLGVAEVLAAIGLTLPGITRIQPWLISWAAVGLMIVMVGATCSTARAVRPVPRWSPRCCSRCSPVLGICPARGLRISDAFVEDEHSVF